jgi:hypothetical protein
MEADQMMEKRGDEVVPRGKRFEPPVKVIFEELVTPVDHGSELFSKSLNFSTIEEKAVIYFLPSKVKMLRKRRFCFIHFQIR